MGLLNRIGNASNPYQGAYKKVLCVCSAGLLRSPTAAFVLSLEPFNFNTRAAGITDEYALIPVDEVLLRWADEIVCMEQWQSEKVTELLIKHKLKKPVLFLDVPDEFEYRNETLKAEIAKRYMEQAK